MNRHPFIAGLIVGLAAFIILICIGLFAHPELLYIYRAVDKFLTG